MAYDNLHNITSKKQHVQQEGIQFDGILKAGYDLAYTYSSEKPHQIANIRDDSYRTESDTIANDVIKRNHTYQYDANGNLVYVNTGREKQDGQAESGANEKKMVWDEENRLQSIYTNGFIAGYWYDAAGERVIKTSGDDEGIYVNDVFSGGRTETADFTAYINPYLVVSKGGSYTKHIYIGSQRIVSKLGDLDSYGQDPRRIEYAGSNVDGANVDYKSKYEQSQQAIKDNYANFEVPYYGTDNDDYVNGQGFCCDNKVLKAGAIGNGNDNPELFQYYYHSDHLGSSSLITNLDGEVVQHVEYVPFGEVFIEERNNTWNTPYLFNAKELDEETGLYYYGARYYDPRTSIWLSTDPLQEKYPHISTYTYTFQNPVKFVDLDGEEPKWGQLANKHQIRREISYALFNKNAENKSIQNQLTVLINHFEANRMFTRKPLLNTLTDIDRSKNVKRYIYTEKGGWIDMHHFFKLAEVTMNYGTASAMAYSGASEAYQYLDSNPSGYSYEDLPSNLAGIAFWRKYGDDILSNKISIKNATTEFLENLGAVDPSEAPNYEYIPHIIDNDYVVRNTTPNPLLGDELKEKHREIHQSRPIIMQNKIKEAHESITD